MSWFQDAVAGLAKPVADTIDALHTSEEERLTLKQKFFELQVGLYNRVLDFETKLVEAQAQIVTAEATSESWLTRNWRPLTAVTFVALVVFRWTGLGPLLGMPEVVISENIEEKLWTAIQICLGGYVGGRTLEKIAPSIADAIGNMKKTS